MESFENAILKALVSRLPLVPEQTRETSWFIPVIRLSHNTFARLLKEGSISSRHHMLWSIINTLQSLESGSD